MPLMRSGANGNIFINSGISGVNGNNVGDILIDISTTPNTYYNWNGTSWVAASSGSNTGIVVSPYSTTIGDYTTPSSVTASSSNTSNVNVGTANNTGSNQTGWGNVVNAAKITGMTVGSIITHVGLKIHTAAGNVRVKVYQDDGAGGDPSTLLAQSNSIATSGVDVVQYFQLTTTCTVPASGNAYAAFESDNPATLSLGAATGGTGVLKQSAAHTYGTGPSPFGTVTTTTTPHYAELINQTGASTNAIDNNTGTFWKSNNEANPNIYADMGSAGNLAACAIYYDGTDTTSTQILIQTSPDAVTWTTVRTVNTNLLTNQAWNYIRWNFPNTAQPRYVRFYGNDGTKILAFYEIKILNASSYSLNTLHGHKSISNSDGTLALNT